MACTGQPTRFARRLPVRPITLHDEKNVSSVVSIPRREQRERLLLATNDSNVRRRLVSKWNSARAFGLLHIRLLRKLWRKRQKLVCERERERVEKNARAESVHLLLAIPCAVGGTIMTVAFLPFAITSAMKAGGDPIGVVFLQVAPDGIPQGFFDLRFPLYSHPSARPMVYAFALLYGLTGLVAGLLMISGGLPKLAITANGLYWGYHLTKYVSVDLLHLLSVDAFTGGLFNLKLAYILLAFYLSLALSNIMSRNEYSKERNSFLMSGLNGLFAGWLLGRGFGANSVMFSGMLYILLSYITIWVAESLLRPVLEIIEVVLGPEAWEQFAEERSYSLSEIKRLPSMVSIGPLLWYLVGVIVMFPFLAAAVYYFGLEGVA